MDVRFQKSRYTLMLSTNVAMKPSMTPTSWAVPGPGSKRMWGTLTPVGADMLRGWRAGYGGAGN